MFELKLRHPITTLDNQILFPAGSVFSQKNLDAVIMQANPLFPQGHPLLEYGSIKDHIIKFIKAQPYNVIFSNENEIQKIFGLMEGVNVCLPVLQSIDYFKKNDFYTYRHILTVFALSALMSTILISDPEDMLKDIASGPVHDFGKICIPLHILQKSDPLTRSERGILEHHAIAGYALIGYYFKDSGHILAEVARDHHERRDGTGYPRGIELKNQIVEIIAVCDVYDALISSRPYRPVAYDNRTAIEEVTRMAEKNLFNWEIVHVLIALNRKGERQRRKCEVSREKRGTPPLQNNYGVFADKKDSVD